MWREEGYKMKYILSSREILRAKPEGFREGSGYISLYVLTWVTMQTFSIINQIYYKSILQIKMQMEVQVQVEVQVQGKT